MRGQGVARRSGDLPHFRGEHVPPEATSSIVGAGHATGVGGSQIERLSNQFSPGQGPTGESGTTVFIAFAHDVVQRVRENSCQCAAEQFVTATEFTAAHRGLRA